MAGNMNQLMAIEIEAGAAGNFDYVVTRGFEIVDVLAITTAPEVTVTTTPQTNISGAGFVALSAALLTDTLDDIEYADTIVQAQATLTVGDTIRSVIANATTGTSDGYYWVLPTSWIAG